MNNNKLSNKQKNRILKKEKAKFTKRKEKKNKNQIKIKELQNSLLEIKNKLKNKKLSSIERLFLMLKLNMLESKIDRRQAEIEVIVFQDEYYKRRNSVIRTAKGKYSNMKDEFYDIIDKETETAEELEKLRKTLSYSKNSNKKSPKTVDNNQKNTVDDNKTNINNDNNQPIIPQNIITQIHSNATKMEDANVNKNKEQDVIVSEEELKKLQEKINIKKYELKELKVLRNKKEEELANLKYRFENIMNSKDNEMKKKLKEYNPLRLRWEALKEFFAKTKKSFAGFRKGDGDSEDERMYMLRHQTEDKKIEDEKLKDEKIEKEEISQVDINNIYEETQKSDMFMKTEIEEQPEIPKITSRELFAKTLNTNLEYLNKKQEQENIEKNPETKADTEQNIKMDIDNNEIEKNEDSNKNLEQQIQEEEKEKEGKTLEELYNEELNKMELSPYEEMIRRKNEEEREKRLHIAFEQMNRRDSKYIRTGSNSNILKPAETNTTPNTIVDKDISDE